MILGTSEKQQKLKKNWEFTLLLLLSDNNSRVTALSQINDASSPVPNSKCHFNYIRPDQEYNYKLIMYEIYVWNKI